MKMNRVKLSWTTLMAALAIGGSIFFGDQPRLSAQQSGVSSEVKMPELPGFSNYRKVATSRAKFGRSGRVTGVKWSEDGRFLKFRTGRKSNVINLESGEESKETFVAATPAKRVRVPVGKRAGVTRAKQRLWINNPANTLKAQYKDFNVQLVELAGENEGKVTPVTTRGDVKVRYGTCCWVYGEELDQQNAMWWSPNGRYLAFYRVSETHMKDYHLSVDNTKVYPTLETTRYPTAGEKNPHVALLIYDLETKKTKELKIEGPVDQYIYDIQFTPDSKHLMFHRTGRRQAKMDLMMADVSTGAIKNIVTETQDTWQKNSPFFRFLSDGQRFIWETERNGFRHFELRNLDGKLLNPISKVAQYPCLAIVDVDEKSGWVYYSAYSAENPYNLQLHRSRLDGSQNSRLTKSPLNHTSFHISHDDKYIVTTYESAAVPPTTSVYSTDGKVSMDLAKSQGEVKKEMGLTHSEVFHFTAEDGKTKIYGILHKPSNFDPQRKYPLIIDVYGGPESKGLTNNYGMGNPNCEFGYLIAKIGNRGTINRGKAFESATYKNLGGPDLNDQADGVRFLSKRPYVDSSRVGIYGHSYGGYMSALALLRHPDVFHVGVSGAPVTAWKNYDTIYTERYMQTPQENRAGYENGSCMKYSRNLKGRLMIIHGLKDDNVHPSNTYQLIDSLYKANKRFDMLVYPGFRHGIGSTYGKVRWEYFHNHLRPELSGSVN